MIDFLKRLFGMTGSTGTQGQPTRPSGPAASSKPARKGGHQQPPARPASLPSTAPAAAKAGTAAKGFRPNVKTWAYQLQGVQARDIAASSADLVVIDYSADGSDDEAFKPADLARMKARPEGGPKKVVSYMSIGEAESYRYYWQKGWKRKDSRPSWLDRENPDWDENFKVRYWDPAWQRIILGTEQSYLDRIIKAGFDGVYLDIIDGFEYYEDSRKSAQRDMVEFVKRIAAHARATRPDFLVIPQNGEALLQHKDYRDVISAIGKEDLLFGVDDDGKANTAEEVGEGMRNLELARRDGIPVMVVEYLDERRKIATACERLKPLL